MFNFFNKDESLRKSAVRQLDPLKSAVLGLETPHKWPQTAPLQRAFEATKKSYSKDLKQLELEANFFFDVTESVNDTTQDTVALLRKWQIAGSAPSLLAMCIFTLEKLNITPAQDTLNMMIMSAVLGEVENTVPYHDNMHYRKVLVQMIRLICVHNDIYAGTSRALDDKEICELLTAACLHDIGHDGEGNVIKGVHIEGRLERLSYDYALPYLTAVGCTDEKTLGKLLVMLLTTDVSPLNDPGNPMQQMKAAYRFHFLGEKARTHTLNLSGNIEVLEKNPKLATQCLLLHEADIATSAGLSYEVTKYETSLLMREFKDDTAHPSNVVDFLKQICQRAMLSEAAQKLYAANLARIYTLAEDEMNAGDPAYPDAEHADFLIGHKSGGNSGTKTIN